MDFVKPIIIQSPISGMASKPQIHTIQVGNKIVTEAHWYDPASGSFIRKGTVSIKDIPKK